MLINYFIAAGIKYNMRPLIFISNDVSDNYPAALERAGLNHTYTDYESADGLLIPGGGDVAPCLYGRINDNSVLSDIELDNFELFMAGRFLIKNKPIMGICRGLQVLNVFFGGTLCQHFDGHNAEKDKQIKCTFYGRFRDAFGKYGIVRCRHHQKVDRLADGLNILAVSDDNCIEAFTDKNVLAVQFHPERMNADGDKIFGIFKSFFS